VIPNDETGALRDGFQRQGRSFGLWVERLLALAVFAGLIRVGWMFFENGYFPQPFFYEPSDTWMDWFNTAYWAHNRGAYDSWLTIYPPLSFVLLKFLGLPGCYADSPGIEMRDCDWLGITSLHAIYLVDIGLIARMFWKIDPRTSLPRSFALTAGMPMFYGLERGNLILFCLAFIALGVGPLLRSARLRWLSLALAVNLKVYTITVVTALLLRRKWIAFEGCVIAIIGVYLLTYAILGSGTPFEIVRNITEFSGSFQSASVLDIWYPSTYTPLQSLLEGFGFPITTVIGSQIAERGLMTIKVLRLLAQSILLLAALATWLRPEKVPPFRAAMFALSLALITSEAGGYTQTMIILLIFMERWEGICRPAAIAICYIVCVPAEIILDSVPTLTRYSYLAGRPVFVDFGIGLGMFMRPMLNMLAPVIIALFTIREVWIDVRDDGRSKRWRYLADAVFLPWIRRSRPLGVTPTVNPEP
jgi:hypothetical protein